VMTGHRPCGSTEHGFGRRMFLGGSLVGAAGLGQLLTGRSAIASQVKARSRRVLNIFLHGGVSQLETWDPKPNTDTGGPFRAIPTTVPGVHICELLPYTAQQMHRLSIVRSLDTRNGDHARGVVEMTTGRPRMPGVEYPHLGAVAARSLMPEDFPLPAHILIRSSPGGRNVESEFHSAAWLGPRYASMALYDANPPKFEDRPGEITDAADERRNGIRQRANERFLMRRRTAETEAYNFSFSQARELLANRHVFEVSRESAGDQERYGTSQFGRHCLLARRLLEHGVPYVQVNHADYDTHHENFDFHIEQLGEFDQPFAQLVADLADRGLLADTLICVMSEFGRTPKINKTYGRDHWGTAWSVLLGGAAIQPGAVIGKTNANGTEVTDRVVDHGHIFHTILRGAGVDSLGEFEVGGRLFPIADPARQAISELLS
ncbi:MAG: DUF1501 domain-containing protein, partial [Planctomyces sp.]